MTDQATYGALLRIAVALERQVAQHDEAVERNLHLRDDNIRRYQREQDEAKADSEILRGQLDEMIGLVRLHHQRLLALESAQATDAVDPSGESEGTPSTRAE